MSGHVTQATLADTIVQHARWLEDIHSGLQPFAGTATDTIHRTRIELAWRAVTRARDEERYDRHPTIPRISIRGGC